MKEIALTKGFVALVDDEDFPTLSSRKWRVKEGKNTCYAYGFIKQKRKTISLMMHREILGVTDPNLVVDHIDGNGLNNCKSNLRICTHSQNTKNSRVRSDNTSGYKGVSFIKSRGRWLVNIKVNYKGFYVGEYDNPEEAARWYNYYAAKFHKQFAKLNDVSPKFPTNEATKSRHPISKSGYVGVYQNTENTWYAQVKVRGKYIFVGTFDTPKKASIARAAKIKELLREEKRSRAIDQQE